MSRTVSQHRARKRFGQNFLHDAAVVQRILASVNPQAGEHVVEIGPGHGALTTGLVDSNATVDVIELDRDLVPGLLAAHGLSTNFTLHSADALNFNYGALSAKRRAPLRIVGNLPYNISTPLLMKLLETPEAVLDMHFMLQREVVERLAAEPGSKAWGRLGITTQYLCDVDYLFDVPPDAFSPAPRVMSAVVRITPHLHLPWPDCDRAQLQAVVKTAFGQRRKTLRNNLKGLIDSEALEAMGIDPGQRAETLGIAEFIRIANAVVD